MTLMVLVAAGRVRCRLAPSRGCCDGGSGLDDQHRDAPGLVKHLVGRRTESGALALPRMGALGADDDEPGARVATACTPDRPHVPIINVARDASARLIVVGAKGAHAREGQRTALGSTTNKVLHEAGGIPVLVV